MAKSKKIIIPQPLVLGNTVGIVAPSGYMDIAKTTACVQYLQQQGYKVIIGKTLGKKQKKYFSGTDAERLKDLQQMLNNPQVKAILCARGGYGLSRIIDDIDFSAFLLSPKWLIGFSDITVLHSHINKKLGVATLHASMAAAFNEEKIEANPNVQSLLQLLKGEKNTYTLPAHRYNQLGEVTAPLVGGNLAIIAHLIGSTSIYNFKNKILFLEDVGEYLYNIDRMLVQLKRAGVFNQIAGLVIGGFTDGKDTVVPFGQNLLAIIKQYTSLLNIPVCFNFPVSHGSQNVALMVGGTYNLQVKKQTTVLKLV